LIAQLNPDRYRDAEQRSDVWPLRKSGELETLITMGTTEEQLAEQAMNLPSESRARLADLLVESLDANELGHIDLDRLWVAEAKRRRNMLVAAVTVHLKNGFFLPNGYEYTLMLLAATVSLFLAGSGEFAMDNILFRETKTPVSTTPAMA